MWVRLIVILVLGALVAWCGVGATTTLAATTTLDPRTPGVVWARVVDDALQDGSVNALTAGGPGLVAVGQDYTESRYWGGIWVSEDGYDWTRVELRPSEERSSITSVTVWERGLVAIKGWRVWMSADGYNWTDVAGTEESLGGVLFGVGDVVAGGPGLVAVGSRLENCTSESMGGPTTCDTYGLVLVSTDGRTWTSIGDDAAFYGAGMGSVTVGGPGLVAVGEAVWVSADGYTWARVPDDQARLSVDEAWTPTVSSVVTFGSGLVAVGNLSRGPGSDQGPVVWVSPPPG